MYRKSFFIDQDRSNNSFSYSKRENKKVHVPALINGSIKDVAIGEHIAFEDFDENGELSSCKGLKNFIKTVYDGVPVYIFDNHNHAFAFWSLEQCKDATLIHIDQHKDTRTPDSYLKPDEDVFAYTNSVLNVGNFIPAAQKAGLIKNIINICSENDLNNFQLPKSDNIILDVDMDFFAPELDYIGNEAKIKLIKSLIPRAKVVTIATSPFFIDQHLAIKYLRKIFS